MNLNLKLGDLVMLKSGGPRMTVCGMTVCGLKEDEIMCEWFDREDKTLTIHPFKEDVLNKRGEGSSL